MLCRLRAQSVMSSTELINLMKLVAPFGVKLIGSTPPVFVQAKVFVEHIMRDVDKYGATKLKFLLVRLPVRLNKGPGTSHTLNPACRFVNSSEREKEREKVRCNGGGGSGGKISNREAFGRMAI